jgi:hypothetical protein
MSTNDRRGKNGRASSVPPEPAQIAANWDDETVPGLDLDDPLNEFDRVTAIPELPSDLYVKQVMETAEDSRVPLPDTMPPEPPPPAPQTLAPDEYFSLDSLPPEARDADSTAPYPAILRHHLQNAPTTRPAPLTLPTRSPGVPPAAASHTGLELADLDSFGSLLAAPRAAPTAVHDPRDPVLELSFDESEQRREHKVPEGGAIGDMKDRYAMGDFSGALVIAEGILESNPEDREASRYAQSCRGVLTQMYSARIGAMDQIVAVAVPSDQIRWLTLDHRAGFLLSLIDGGSTVDQILDISGMTRLDALRIMYQLLEQRVISLSH